MKKGYRLKRSSVKANNNEFLWLSVLEPILRDIRFEEAADRKLIASLTPAQRALAILYAFTDAVMCDGIDAYFFEGRGILPAEAPQAYELIGARGYAKRVRQICGLFPNGEPPRDEEEGLKTSPEPDSEMDRAFRKFDSDFMDFAISDGDPGGLAARYIQNHPEEFFLG